SHKTASVLRLRSTIRSKHEECHGAAPRHYTIESEGLMLRLCWVLFPLALSAQTVDEAGAIFVKHVRPLLQEKCAGCHGPALQSNGLRLTSRDALLMGGKRGPAIVPGEASRSLIVSALEQSGALKMPPGQKLPAES